jgi:putative oxidoreductase
MRRFYTYYTGRLGAGLLLLRLIVGIAFLFHGWPKIEDPGAFAGMMHLPLWLGTLAAWVEVVGGALLLLGLFTPLAGFLLAAQMVGTFPVYHLPHHIPFINPSGPNYELALVYLAVALLYLLAGPGAYSADAYLLGGQRVENGERAQNRRRGLA